MSMPEMETKLVKDIADLEREAANAQNVLQQIIGALGYAKASLARLRGEEPPIVNPPTEETDAERPDA